MPTLWWWNLQSTTPPSYKSRHACQLWGVAVEWQGAGTCRSPSASLLVKPHSCCRHVFSVQPSYNSAVRRGFEQLLRRLQAMPSQPSLLLLQLYPWWQAFGDGVTHGLYYREPENQMTVLGQASWRLCWKG